MTVYGGRGVASEGDMSGGSTCFAGEPKNSAQYGTHRGETAGIVRLYRELGNSGAGTNACRVIEYAIVVIEPDDFVSSAREGAQRGTVLAPAKDQCNFPVS